jgi:hypothetical protein
LLAIPEPNVVSCGRCQQSNWIPAGYQLDRMECTHCGATLAATPTRKPRAKLAFLSKLLTALAFVGLWLLFEYRDVLVPHLGRATVDTSDVGEIASDARPPSSATQRPSDTDAIVIPSKPTPPSAVENDTSLPQPVSISDGIVRVTKAKTRVVPFQIRTVSGSNYFIKLVNAADDSDMYVLFVRGGSTFKITMPIGTYRLQFASGKTWYGEKALFGEQTTYWTADQMLSFRKSGNDPKPVTIEIPDQRAGHIRSVPFDPARF